MRRMSFLIGGPPLRVIATNCDDEDDNDDDDDAMIESQTTPTMPSKPTASIEVRGLSRHFDDSCWAAFNLLTLVKFTVSGG